MRRQGYVSLPADWAEHRDAAYKRHFSSLDTLYFSQGKRRLESLEAWTRGEADGPHIDERVPAAVSDENWREER